jgi:hypothetical protein
VTYFPRSGTVDGGSPFHCVRLLAHGRREPPGWVVAKFCRCPIRRIFLIFSDFDHFDQTLTEFYLILKNTDWTQPTGFYRISAVTVG